MRLKSFLVCVISVFAVFPFIGGDVHAAMTAITKEINLVTKQYNINVKYPVFGHAQYDASSKKAAEAMVAMFTMSIDRNAPKKARPAEFRVTYEVIPGDSKVITIFWTAVRKNVSVATRTDYHSTILVDNGGLLNYADAEFVDLFEDGTAALEILSDYARRQFKARLGAMDDEKRFAKRSAPDVPNFSLCAPVHKALRVWFQPHALLSEQNELLVMDVPLDLLVKAKPNYIIWSYSK